MIKTYDQKQYKQAISAKVVEADTITISSYDVPFQLKGNNWQKIPTKDNAESNERSPCAYMCRIFQDRLTECILLR